MVAGPCRRWRGPFSTREGEVMESKYDYVVFDIETTGLHPDSDQICEIGRHRREGRPAAGHVLDARGD